MSHHPHDGSADDGLGGALLRFIEDGRIPELRQALSGFNHRCRNMLNSMKMGFYLAKKAASGPMPERWDDLQRTYQEVERLFDLMQSIYRTMELTTVRQPFRAVVEERGPAWRAAFEAEGATLAIRPPAQEAAGEFDAMRIASAFDAFAAWRASRLGPGGRASLSWGTTRRHFEVSWNEASPTGSLAKTSTSSCPVAGLAAATRSLALPLLARVVSEHQGRLSWTPGPAVEARIRWPLAAAQAAPPPPHRPASFAAGPGRLAARP